MVKSGFMLESSLCPLSPHSTNLGAWWQLLVSSHLKALDFALET